MIMTLASDIVAEHLAVAAIRAITLTMATIAAMAMTATLDDNDHDCGQPHSIAMTAV